MEYIERGRLLVSASHVVIVDQRINRSKLLFHACLQLGISQVKLAQCYHLEEIFGY